MVHISAIPILLFNLKAANAFSSLMCPSKPYLFGRTLSAWADQFNPEVEDAYRTPTSATRNFRNTARKGAVLIQDPQQGTKRPRGRPAKPIHELSVKYQRRVMHDLMDGRGFRPPESRPQAQARRDACAQAFVEKSKLAQQGLYRLLEDPFALPQKERILEGATGVELARSLAVPVEAALLAKDQTCMSDESSKVYFSTGKNSVVDLPEVPRLHDIVAYRHLLDDSVKTMLRIQDLSFRGQ